MMKIDEKTLLEDYFPQAYEQIKKIVAIPSYAQPAALDAPYGLGVKAVLDYAVNLAKNLGFSTHQDLQNRYGYLDFGTGEELFVILCHLDVVPPGKLDQWKTDPFTLTEVDGRLVGRGVFDDKGPTIINLYALKYLLDNGFQPGYKIRLLFGLTEETTWLSIKAYIEDYGVENVVMGYTPDGDFPVVYAEKWVVDLDLKATQKADFTIQGGAAYNVVNDVVTYQGPHQDTVAAWLKDQGIATTFDENQHLVVQGQAAHGSLPHLGVNAATWLGKALKQTKTEHQVVDLLDLMHLDFNASHLQTPVLHDETGELTQNLGIIAVEDGYQVFKLNFRVPALADVQKDFIIPYTERLSGLGFVVENIKIEDHVYVSQDSELIKKLLTTYREVTGEVHAQPLAIGGGTYAKAMPNVVAFGAEFDLEHSTMHAYNESVKVADLQKMLLIYTKSLVALTKKD